MFDRILLAVDGSEQSDRAVSLANEIAKQGNAEVLVFHVREKAAVRFGSYDVDLDESEVNIADSTARTLKDRGVSARPERVTDFYGHTAKRIVEAADEFGANLIVMGSRGLSDLGGFFLGSVAHKVLQSAPCHVLVAR